MSPAPISLILNSGLRLGYWLLHFSKWVGTANAIGWLVGSLPTPNVDNAADAAKLSLRGPVDENGMARFFRRRGEGVYDMDDLKRRTADLALFLAAAFHRYGRDPARSIGIGYSNGANILANLAFTQPLALGGYALMHPLIPFDPVPQPGLKGVPVLITSGARDPIAPAPMTAHLEDYFTSHGAKLTRLRHMGGHELRPEEIDAVARFAETIAA